ncbi:MAG: DUF370 domain-containing protein [Eubacteriales bacterium]|nr:DUF370 domain-containing protein [Bacillota bacterium]MBV1727934.1 DUF370 domain-containing protein [Desulforudis sp.]MDQ7789069.1 DUF370 domain-containing protein [Clostridia bacterium]MDZ4042171.1 DUF370 domain-containing protein [Eubacteriales bacterium]MBU4534103.1 DUF370 domain-containing protein [Bacillota bacterium]
MFLHLGADVMVLKEDIVAILDLETRTANTTRDFLKIARDHRILESSAEGERLRSYIITTDRVFLSPISCGTLKKRAGLTWSQE